MGRTGISRVRVRAACERINSNHMEAFNRQVLKLVIILVLMTAYFFAYLFTPHASFEGSRTVEIAKGDGSRTVAEKLKTEGIIGSKWMFVAYATFSGKAALLKPGSFVFSSHSAIPEIVATLSKGETKERVIQVREGWNSYDIARYLDRGGIADAKGFLRIASGENKIVHAGLIRRFSFLSEIPTPSGLEGFLFPDTYRIYHDASAEDIIARQLENFEKKVGWNLRDEIEKQGKTLFEIITMASLIEKEVHDEMDQKAVSGVLWKRLELGMGLQVDATINYIRQTRYGLDPTTKISIDDTRIDSPYNTYLYRGLPPGPIANPGLSAIRAAIFPQESDYLYYLSTQDGKTIFSRTLDEHNIAKAKYLR